VRRSFNQSVLSDLRALSSVDVLASLATLIKSDRTFVPSKDARTQRWHVHTERGDFEILTTGPKWYDTRARIGGGGAIDLAMHILDLSFVDAVRRLTANNARHGSDHS
jgi:hypothetical protein